MSAVTILAMESAMRRNLDSHAAASRAAAEDASPSISSRSRPASSGGSSGSTNTGSPGRASGAGAISATDSSRRQSSAEATTLAQRLHLVLEEPDSSALAWLFSHFSLFIIVLSIGCFVVETLPSVRHLHYLWDSAEMATTIAFTLEYLLRLATCNSFGQKPQAAFIVDPMNVLDFLALIPFYIEKVVENLDSMRPLRVLRSVRLIRCFRIFRLSKYNAGMTLMVQSLMNSMKPLSILLFFLGISILLFSALLYYAERWYCPDVEALIAAGQWGRYQQDCADAASTTSDGQLCCNEFGSANAFQSIAMTFWWSIVTTTTTGYGDSTPSTPLGMLVAGMAMLTGIVLISLPVAIVGTKFQQAYEDYEVERDVRVLRAAEERKVAVVAPLDPSAAAAVSAPAAPPSGGAHDAGSAVASAESPPAGGVKPSSPADADAAVAESTMPVKRKRTAAEIPRGAAANLIPGLRAQLQALESSGENGKPKGKLSSRQSEQVQLLLELFDHIELAERRLASLHAENAALDEKISRDFVAASWAYDTLHCDAEST
eukprot:TRINITY_DN13223_c1_g1_i5.p1 TRINITY_DN13223_c1_g1~~TRINITY_DN13223_c1_g1_i5.p1  ORF type:complete len:545 (+),score=81.75 TRINITY_DN13223_c1_g1_i5:73-1707(+)